MCSELLLPILASLITDPENPKAVPSILHQGKKTLIRASAPARIETRLTFGKSARTLAKTGPGLFSNSETRCSSAWCTKLSVAEVQFSREAIGYRSSANGLFLP